MPGKLPFWKGDAVGRPIELGRAIGRVRRRDRGGSRRGRARAQRRGGTAARAPRPRRACRGEPARLPRGRARGDRRAADRQADRRRAVPRRARRLAADAADAVRRPRPRAVVARDRGSARSERLGIEVQTIWSDDGIAIRLPEGDATLDGIEALLFPDPDEVEDLVVGQVATSALFASRFRENAARALLLPRRRPGTRTPLWQQRQRAADLLAVATRYGSFPILVETYRECLSDVFDLPALREVLGGVARREIAVHGVETPRASPFASSLLFDYVAAYMYDGDAPLAERRAGALTLDRDLLRELLGQEELRELLDPEALADLELSLQALTEDRQATTARPASTTCCAGSATCRPTRSRRASRAAPRSRTPGSTSWPRRRRAVRARIAGDERWIAIEDVARYRDGVGVSPPVGVPEAFLGPATRRARRAARPLGPDARPVPHARAGPALGPARRDRRGRARTAARAPARSCAASSGPAAPSASGATRTSCGCCAAGRWRGSVARSSRSTRRRSPGSCPSGTASRRRSGRTGAVPWHRPRSSASPRSSTSSPALPIPASVLERDVLPARVPGYQPRLLDELGRDGRGRLGRAGAASAATTAGSSLVPARARGPAAASGPPDGIGPSGGPRHDAIREHLGPRGASLLPRAPRGRGRRLRPRRARRAVGPRLGRRGHERHVRAAARAALEADRRRRRPRAAAGPADGARPARGGRPLVARRARRTAARRPERLHAQALALLERHGVLTREAVAAEGVEGGFTAVYPSCARWRRPGRIRRGYFVDGLGAAQFALPGALDRLRAVREPAEPPASAAVHVLAAADPAQPVWRRAAVAAARRRRPAAAPAGGRRVCRARRRRRGPVPRAGRRDAPDAAGGGRPGRRRAAVRAPRRRSSPTVAYASSSITQGRRASPSVESPWPRCACSTAGLRAPAIAVCVRCAGRSRRSTSARRRHARSDRGRAPALPRRTAGDRRPRPGPGPGARRSQRLVGARIDRSRRRARTCSSGSTAGSRSARHLRMNGSWHRYRPGERWRRPPVAGAARARGRRAPSPSASTRRWWSSSRRGPRPLHPALSPARAGPAGRRLRRRRGACAGCATRARADRAIAEALLDQRALAGIGNVYKNEVLFIERVVPVPPVARSRRRDPRRLVATARRLLVANAIATRGPERVTTAGDRARPAPLTSTAATGGRAGAAGPRSRPSRGPTCRERTSVRVPGARPSRPAA